jgi:hypothetical protein
MFGDTDGGLKKAEIETIIAAVGKVEPTITLLFEKL